MNLYRNSRFLLIGAILIFNLLLLNCGKNQEDENEITHKPQNQTEQITKGGVYRVPLLNNPPTLDPAYVQGQYGVAVVQQLFDGLVRFDPYLLITPALAETWEIIDHGKKYRFTLRSNALFHNGRQVTTEDVVFSINRLVRMDPPPAILPHLLKIVGAKDYRNQKSSTISGLTIEDERKFTATLVESHAPFLHALGMYQAKIVPKNEVLQTESQFGDNPVGSGPFQFIERASNELIKLKRFNGYYDGPAYLDEIHYSIYPGGKRDNILIDFKENKLEEMPVFGHIRKELSDNKELQWFHRPSLSLLFYGIRGNHPLLGDSKFRSYLSNSIDRNELVTKIYNGQFEPATTVLPPGLLGYRHESIKFERNISSAREYIKSHLVDKKDKIPNLEIVSGSKSAFAEAELGYIRDCWTDLGIPIRLKYITDWSKFVAYLKSNAVQIFRYAWFADMPDPDSFLYPMFATNAPANFMGYQNKTIDQMLLSARGITDTTKRAEMYSEIENQILKSTPIIPLFYLSVDRVYKPKVQGAKPSALGANYMPLHRVWFKLDSSGS